METEPRDGNDRRSDDLSSLNEAFLKDVEEHFSTTELKQKYEACMSFQNSHIKFTLGAVYD